MCATGILTSDEEAWQIRAGIAIADDPSHEVVGRRDDLDFSSGYVQRAIDRFPRRSSKAPWVLTQNYVQDIFLIRFGRLDDGALVFRRAHESPVEIASPLVAAE